MTFEPERSPARDETIPLPRPRGCRESGRGESHAARAVETHAKKINRESWHSLDETRGILRFFRRRFEGIFGAVVTVHRPGTGSFFPRLRSDIRPLSSDASHFAGKNVPVPLVLHEDAAPGP